jgi:hypothetical protein
MMIRERNVLFLIVLLASACSTAGGGKTPVATVLFDIPPTPATTLFDIPPTPVLELAGTYMAGQNDIPPGKYLAVQAWSDSNGRSSNGKCPYAAMIDFPMYGMQGDELQSFVEPNWEYTAENPGPPDFSKAVGFFGYGSSNSGDMGGGVSSDLTAFFSLPANPKQSIFTIYSAAADGTIVVQIGSQVYRMKPGERWVQYSESQPDENCHRLDTGTFTNYGLLDGSQIDIAGTTLTSAFTPTP